MGIRQDTRIATVKHEVESQESWFDSVRVYQLSLSDHYGLAVVCQSMKIMATSIMILWKMKYNSIIDYTHIEKEVVLE